MNVKSPLLARLRRIDNRSCTASVKVFCTDVGKLIPLFPVALVALVTCQSANNRIHKRPFGSTTGQLVPLRARCKVTSSIYSLQFFCTPNEPLLHSSSLCLSSLVIIRWLDAMMPPFSSTSSLPILLYSQSIEPCLNPQGLRHLHKALLLTVRIHPREIPPRARNLHLRSVLASRFPRGLHLHHRVLLQVLPERSLTGSLRVLRSSTLPHARRPSHKFKFNVLIPRRAANRGVVSSTSTSSDKALSCLRTHFLSSFFFGFRDADDHPGWVKYIHLDGSTYYRHMSGRLLTPDDVTQPRIRECLERLLTLTASTLREQNLLADLPRDFEIVAERMDPEVPEVFYFVSQSLRRVINYAYDCPCVPNPTHPPEQCPSPKLSTLPCHLFSPVISLCAPF